MRRIARFALFGAVGFGIGGLFPGPAALFAFAISFQRTEIWPSGVIAFAILGFGFAVKGALGGTALGLAFRRGRRVVATLALFGGIGFLIGGFLNIFLPPFLSVAGEPMLGTTGRVIPSGIVLLDGALGGAVLGVALRDKRKIIGLAIAGALGFWIGLMVGNWLHYWLGFGFLLVGIVRFAIQGIIGGASLGIALAYLEKG